MGKRYLIDTNVVIAYLDNKLPGSAMKFMHGVIDEIVDKTISVYRERRIKLPDGIIAATALNFDLILLTRNIPDFKNISCLKLLNPWEL